MARGGETQRLAQSADHLTVVDSSPEVLEINRRRTARADVEYVVADLFAWVPERSYDVVFFSFWLSHVPRERCAAFWSMVRSCSSPGGRVFVIDNHSDPHIPESNSGIPMSSGTSPTDTYDDSTMAGSTTW